MIIPDLHCHSTYSDGTLTPEQLLARAAERGVKVLALTDHDETSGLLAAHAAAERHGIQLIDGVEISVTWRGQTLHILGLGIDTESAGIKEGLAETRAGRHRRAQKIAEALAECGIPGAMEGARQFAGNPDIIGRTHFARFMVQQGAVKDIKTAFKRYLIGGQPCYVPHQWATLKDAVSWITGSGGIAAIAHPGRYTLDNQQLRELLTEFRELGGEAIEVVSGSHTPQQHATFAAYAHEYGFMASAGSDFHSPQESRYDLGKLPALPAGCVPVWHRLGIEV